MIRTLVFCSLCLFAISAHGAIVIDSFDDMLSAPYYLEVTDSILLAETDQSGLSGVLGGNRRTLLEHQPPVDTGSAFVSIENGMVLYSETTNVDSIVTFRYGSELAPLNVNFANLSAFTLYLDSDFSPANSLRVGIELVSGLGGTPITSSLSYDLTSDPTDDTVRFDFADFSGGVDFSDIDQITLTLDALTGAPDTSVLQFAAVPEPSVVSLTALVALILAGIGIRPFRRVLG